MKRVLNYLKDFHNDERGAEGLEKLLIIAAIVLPLLAMLIFMRDWITEWVGGDAQEVREGSEEYDPTF